MVVSLLIAAAAFQGAVADGPRKEFVACLRTAVSQAQAAKVAADGFESYAHQNCAAAEAALKNGLTSFNVKNGMSKKTAADDAQLQIDDYVLTASENYKFKVADAKPQ